ncbi:MAG: hypothetical protein LIO60_04460 [Oscillospiraceae bacterium]|nr:hypothetical protein [Oscillospiraceae bacterium]
MEERNINVIYGKAGGNASRNSYTCKVSLPKTWLDRMGVTLEHRGMTLSFDEKRIILERADGQGMKQVPLANKKEIRRFALVWREMYKNHATIPGYFFEDIDFMGKGLSDLGFIMDCGESVKRVFPGVNVFGDNEALQRIINEFDIQLLGNAIYSQWRYFNHWAMAPMNEDDYQWFVITLSRLAELCE